ncbi:MAG: SMI1/KNR4 family protein [Bacteroidia bacterium]|nr:SMI1/KNR4 family protein [Bacteroidia bacterium]
MTEGISNKQALPPVFFEWLATVRRLPMFDVWRQGTLCSIRLVHILDISDTDLNIFIHRSRIEGLFPDSFLPLGYDAFGNLLLWDIAEGGVYLHWRGTSHKNPVKVAASLQALCDKLYYRPIQG